MILQSSREKTVVVQTFVGYKQGALWFMSDVKMANKMITELQGLLKNFLKSNKYKDSNGIKK